MNKFAQWLLMTAAALFSAAAFAQDEEVSPRFWGNVDYKGRPWVENVSRPFDIRRGLEGRHLSVWSSHGRYYDQDKGRWKWQRPELFCTTEDLFTQTIVIPYLIPMLENAGAIVFTPRERDWQRNECIVDNDISRSPHYLEVNMKGTWKASPARGFGRTAATLQDGENPFEKGTAREAKATKNKKKASEISYQPQFTEAGRYAVYVSYPTVEKSVDDAQYIVWHKGQATEFRVNQQMGGGTWVYLGTFDFDKGSSMANRVVLTNRSSRKGVVTADAVRFGGGTGNISRGGQTSGLPRTLEGARYTAQWSGVPYAVYSTRGGTNDYADDINSRSLMTNWLAGGSVFAPDKEGKGVPIELSLAVHSDAGYAKEEGGLIGSLAICTTDYNDGRLGSGVSRGASKRLASLLLSGIRQDIQRQYGHWNIRALWDKNYSETRLPACPSAIIETLSHQNFPDMVWAQDPNFRFTMARSIYKTILRYVNEGHGDSYTVTPLTPDHLSVSLSDKGTATLRWQAVSDKAEPSARADAFIVYTALGQGGYDNGVKGRGNSWQVQLQPGLPCHFRVAACNEGGVSFPSETVSAVWEPTSAKTVLIVNGFHRLSSPAVVSNDSLQGFDLDRDPGVFDGVTAGISGRQICFDKSRMGIEGPGGLGYSGSELVGKFLKGNDGNVVREHTDALVTARKYNIVSCSADAFLAAPTDPRKIQAIDLILGLEKYDPHALKFYKTFTARMRQRLTDYTREGGCLLVSGSYIGSDMPGEEEQSFLLQTLKLRYEEADLRYTARQVTGLGMTMPLWRTLNEQHYAVTSPEVLTPADGAMCVMQYEGGGSAAVAYGGTGYKCFTMGFPLECIADASQRSAVMRGAVHFLLPQ